MHKKYNRIINILGKERVLLNEPLRIHTYFKIGGPADLFYIANNAEDLFKATTVCLRQHVPYFILGGGSNILVSDRGIRGLVIRNRANKIKIQKLMGKVKDRQIDVQEAQVYAESGVITNLLVRRTIQEGLKGLEYFLGVPGTIGGAVYNNSHYKKELIGDRVKVVEVVSKTGEKKEYTKSQMKFKYDSSILQKTNEVVLNVTFQLSGGKTGLLWKYAEEFAKMRSDTQPLKYPSAGCIFKNLEEKDKSTSKSAGSLIDAAGLKGVRIGGAQVSEKHANFIVNTGNATAKDVVKLIELIKGKVKNQFGVKLETEIFKVGKF